MNLSKLLWPHLHKFVINYSCSNTYCRAFTSKCFMRKLCISSEHLFMREACVVDPKCVCVCVCVCAHGVFVYVSLDKEGRVSTQIWVKSNLDFMKYLRAHSSVRLQLRRVCQRGKHTCNTHTHTHTHTYSLSLLPQNNAARCHLPLFSYQDFQELLLHINTSQL